MDSVTHAVSGAALLLAMPRRPETSWAVPLSMVVTSLPDIDFIFHRIPIDSVLLHRGITHALPALPVFAPLCALLMYPFWRRGTAGAQKTWTFLQTTLFACLLLLMHIWLDCLTTYGTLAFLPFSDYRVRLNGLFIIDFLLLIPLILACCVSRRRPSIAAMAVIWLLFYSGGAVAWSMYLQNKWAASLRAADIVPAELSVLPDAFSPFYWKVQYKHGDQCFQAPLDWNGAQTGPLQQQQSADPVLLAHLASEDRSARIWIGFSLLPLQEKFDWEGGKEYGFYDWRFSSFVPFIQSWRSNDDHHFRLLARFDGADKLVAVRYIGHSGKNSSGWNPPKTPKGRSGLNWLIGLDD
jgi:inner membrane protein